MEVTELIGDEIETTHALTVHSLLARTYEEEEAVSALAVQFRDDIARQLENKPVKTKATWSIEVYPLGVTAIKIMGWCYEAKVADKGEEVLVRRELKRLCGVPRDTAWEREFERGDGSFQWRLTHRGHWTHVCRREWREVTLRVVVPCLSHNCKITQKEYKGITYEVDCSTEEKE